MFVCTQPGEELSDMSVLLKDIDDAANAVKLATRKVDTVFVVDSLVIVVVWCCGSSSSSRLPSCWPTV